MDDILRQHNLWFKCVYSVILFLRCQHQSAKLRVMLAIYACFFNLTHLLLEEFFVYMVVVEMLKKYSQIGLLKRRD